MCVWLFGKSLCTCLCDWQCSWCYSAWLLNWILFTHHMCFVLNFLTGKHEWWRRKDLSSLCWRDGFDWSAIEAMQMWLWGFTPSFCYYIWTFFSCYILKSKLYAFKVSRLFISVSSICSLWPILSDLEPRSPNFVIFEGLFVTSPCDAQFSGPIWLILLEVAPNSYVTEF